MTTSRRDNEGTRFGLWLRQQEQLDSTEHGLAATDIDMILHRFAPHIDAVGTREMQLMFALEVKTYSKQCTTSQQETLFFNHQLLFNRRTLVHDLYGNKRTLWHFGWYLLELDGECPESSSTLIWGKFTPKGEWNKIEISENTLIALLGLTKRPDTLRKLDLRRHHKTRAIVIKERMPLGLVVSTLVMKRS
jgi:hypothetical protein